MNRFIPNNYGRAGNTKRMVLYVVVGGGRGGGGGGGVNQS